MTVTVDDTSLKAIADAIRAKNGTEATYKPREMAEAITALSGAEGIKQYIEEASGNVTSVAIPEGITKIKENCFKQYAKLESLSLPNSLVEIGSYAFAECDALTEVIIPAGVTIRDYAFGWCDKLVTITFKGKPTLVKGNVFANSTNIKAINVPWAEGEVANAPWGSAGTVVNYNYKG